MENETQYYLEQRGKDYEDVESFLPRLIETGGMTCPNCRKELKIYDFDDYLVFYCFDCHLHAAMEEQVFYDPKMTLKKFKLKHFLKMCDWARIAPPPPLSQ
jgi:hypothetical protein